MMRLVTQSLSAQHQTNTSGDARSVNQLVAQQHYVISISHPELFTVYQPWLKGFSGQSEALDLTGSNTALWFFAIGGTILD